MIKGAEVKAPKGKWPEEWQDGIHEGEMTKDMMMLTNGDGGAMAWDDVAGLNLDPNRVRCARREEIMYIKKHGVYTRVPAEDQKKTGGKIIDLKWIDVNKGDHANPDYRSRLVGREFNNERDDSLYAATPPLEALRVVLSWASTLDNENVTKIREPTKIRTVFLL